MFIFESERFFPSCHASTLVETASGGLVSAWFAGTKEGAADVAVWSSLLENGHWSPPRIIADHPGEPLWNPVLFRHGSRVILMYRVAPRIPDWRAYMKTSVDGGVTWSDPTPLPEGFLGPIKNKPVRMSNGLWLCGSSVETGTEWYVRMELFDADEDRWVHGVDLRMPNGQGIIQPAVWESQSGRLHALMRSNAGRIVRSDSADSGRTWSTPTPTTLPNNNSGLDVVASSDGTLVLCCNPVADNWGRRTPLVLLMSKDNGRGWPHGYVLEDADGEFSYPAIIGTAAGVALTYTHQRTRICYRTVSLADIEAATPAAGEDRAGSR